MGVSGRGSAGTRRDSSTDLNAARSFYHLSPQFTHWRPIPALEILLRVHLMTNMSGKHGVAGSEED